MEILQTLRNHIINNNKTSFIPNVEIFTTILNNIEKQLFTDQYIARCIDLEGINEI
jgi:hypothetical protein